MKLESMPWIIEQECKNYILILRLGKDIFLPSDGYLNVWCISECFGDILFGGDIGVFGCNGGGHLDGSTFS